MKPLTLLSISCIPLLAQPPADPTPKDVRELIRSAAEALTDKDVRGFLDHFDAKMPGYEAFHYDIEALAARESVLSSIEIVSDSGGDQERALDLDWTLNVDSERLRRAVVKVRIEREGKKWKFVAIDPREFFRAPG